MKNKLGQKVTWKLYRKVVSERYRKLYLWVDPEGIVQHERTISNIGWADIPDNHFETVEKEFKIAKKNPFNDFTLANHKIDDEKMSNGWLLL